MRRQTVLDVAGAVPPEAVEALLAACRSGAFDKAQKAVSNIIADGWLVLVPPPTSPPRARACHVDINFYPKSLSDF